MCYHCATNQSIHHHCCHITTVSSLLSHHGVTFTVTLSQFRHCHCDVAFIVTLLRCCCRSRVVAVPSLLHCHGFVVAVMVSPSSSHCRGFVIAVVVSPSHLSRFCCRCCGVAFMSVAVSLSPSRCCLRHRIVMVSLSSRCCLYRHIVVVSLSRFRCRHCGVAFVVALLQCRHRSRIVAVPLLSHHCGFIVAVAMSPSSSHCHGVRCHFIIAVVVSPSSLHRHGVVVVVALWSLLLRSLLHCGCGHIAVVAVVVASLRSHCCCCCCCCCIGVVVVVVASLLRCGRHCCIMVIAMVVASSLYCRGCCGHGHGRIAVIAVW